MNNNNKFIKKTGKERKKEKKHEKKSMHTFYNTIKKMGKGEQRKK